jgi:hypothetical protein
LLENTAGRQPGFRAKLVPKISVKNYMSYQTAEPRKHRADPGTNILLALRMSGL